VAPERIWKWGTPVRREAEIFLDVPSTFFGSKCTISRFSERFSDGQF